MTLITEDSEKGVAVIKVSGNCIMCDTRTVSPYSSRCDDGLIQYMPPILSKVLVKDCHTIVFGLNYLWKDELFSEDEADSH